MEPTNETINTDTNMEENKKEPADTTGILDKFCWPGFFMPQFWGVANGMPVGVLAFVPILAPIMSLAFGFGGYRSAYVKTGLPKLEFYEKQVKWQKAAIIYTGAVLCMILFLISGRVVNYVTNKMEIARIVEEYEVKEADTIRRVEILFGEENLKAYIGDFDFVPDSELEVSEDGNLWHVQEGYSNQELSEKTIDFSDRIPHMRGATQYFSIDGDRMVWLSVDVDENFDITESQFYLLESEEVEAMHGSGLLLDTSRWTEYIDRETMDQILSERK